MYQYKISVNIVNPKMDIISLLKPEYIKLNANGFIDLLSCCLKTTNNIKYAKDKISHIKEPLWDEIKKLTNPYELIYIAPNTSIANIKPLSRSFFKMIEIINEFAMEIIKQKILISLPDDILEQHYVPFYEQLENKLCWLSGLIDNNSFISCNFVFSSLSSSIFLTISSEQSPLFKHLKEL